jgi:gamma-glutamyltranspeptidase
VSAETGFHTDLCLELERKGHVLTRVGARHGHAHAIRLIDDGYAAATDPRAEGAALGL